MTAQSSSWNNAFVVAALEQMQQYTGAWYFLNCIGVVWNGFTTLFIGYLSSIKKDHSLEFFARYIGYRREVGHLNFHLFPNNSLCFSRRYRSPFTKSRACPSVSIITNSHFTPICTSFFLSQFDYRRSFLTFASTTVVVIGRPDLMRTLSSYHAATRSNISIRRALQKLVTE